MGRVPSLDSFHDLIMRILVYGGCHAETLGRVFNHYVRGDHRFDVLINFELIGSGRPFPYDSLSRYDWVVFSPVLNHGDWNTVHLERACKVAGVRTLKYPWLQWSGYWPQAKRRFWGSKNEWGLPTLARLGRELQDFEPFYDSLFEATTFEEGLPSWLDFTAESLRRHEKTGAVDLPISDWVLAHYRERALFLTPDHPTTFTYQHLVKRIAQAIGLDLDPGFYALTRELQEGVRVPVLPAMQKALHLSFCSAEWSSNQFLGPLVFDLKAFARSYHAASQVFLARSRDRTVIKTPEAVHSGSMSEGRIPVAAGTPMLLRRLNLPEHAGHWPVALVEPFKTTPPTVSPQYVYKHHWTLEAPEMR